MGPKSVSVPVTNLWGRSDAIRESDAPMAAPLPDPEAWTAGLNHEEKLGLYGRLDSQLLCGEPVEVLQQEGDLSYVVASWQPFGPEQGGYPGWVRTDHLTDPPSAQPQQAAVVADSVRLEDHPYRLSFGTVLPAREVHREAVVVELPGGDRATLDSSCCVVRPTDHEWAVSREDVVAAAHRFVGLEYLWGGLSSYGMDCSGLVHLMFRALGQVVPRDARDQAAAALRVQREQVRTADLYFFARPGKNIHHVGFALPEEGPDRMLHAPGTGEGVVAESMTADRAATLQDYVGRFTS